MAQRSYSNDRYRKDAKIGSTRKSAAKAKPVRKQGIVEVSSSTKPKKPQQEKDWAGLPTSPQIKKWRRVWWGLLLGGLALIGGGYAVPELRDSATAQALIALGVLTASVMAVTIDIFIIRKLRKRLIAAQGEKKSGKEAKAAESAGGAGKEAKATESAGGAGKASKREKAAQTDDSASAKGRS